MKHKTLDWALDIATRTSLMSRDPSTKVGAVMVDGDMILSTGYNDLPRGMAHNTACYERSLKYALVVHAEHNCILNAARCGVSTFGKVIISTHEPCSGCCKAAIQAGIGAIHYSIPLEPARWGEDLLVRNKILESCSMQLCRIV